MFLQGKQRYLLWMHFMFMNANSKNKEAAWKLIEYMSSKGVDADSDGYGKDGSCKVLFGRGVSEKESGNGPMIAEAIEIGKGPPKVPGTLTVYLFMWTMPWNRYSMDNYRLRMRLMQLRKRCREEIDNQ